MDSVNNRPTVGMGVVIFKGNKILLGKRKSSIAGGLYASPGGHVEYMETFEECAIRETREECGIEIQNVRFQRLANVMAFKPKHFVDISLIADWKSGEPQNLEPDKNEGWDWYDLDNLPTNLMATTKLTLESCKTGQMYFPLID
ncbi:MAG: mismatch repair protein MutT [Candidatus Taylorbacteria bacterium]|nr:mismatch repair protein MutT [Candidatus Taylorbacteria bacterium]